MQIKELCGVRKGLDEIIDEGILWWFSHVERMERDMIAERVYVRECAGIRSMGRAQKRWIDIMKSCLRKGGLDVRREWWRFVRGNAWGIAHGMNP